MYWRPAESLSFLFLLVGTGSSSLGTSSPGSNIVEVVVISNYVFAASIPKRAPRAASCEVTAPRDDAKP